MDLINKVTISHFIWYLVPGVAAIFIFIFPIIAVIPGFGKQFFEILGPAGLIFLAIILGFLLDGLRLYRFRCGYDKIKKDFFIKLKKITNSDLDPYVIQSHISDVARKKEVTGIGINHAIWIMHGHFSILCFIEAFLWVIIFAIKLFSTETACIFYDETNWIIFGIYFGKRIGIATCLTITTLFFLIGNRLQKISIEDQNKTNNMFLEFAEQNLKEVKEHLNIS